jgi:hypothetical protein
MTPHLHPSSLAHEAITTTSADVTLFYHLSFRQNHHEMTWRCARTHTHTHTFRLQWQLRNWQRLTVQEFSKFYGAHRSITVTKTSHINSVHPIITLYISILILSSHVSLGPPNCLFKQTRTPTQFGKHVFSRLDVAWFYCTHKSLLAKTTCILHHTSCKSNTAQGHNTTRQQACFVNTKMRKFECVNLERDRCVLSRTHVLE